MQNQFYNRPVVDWGRNRLPQPVEIKQRFASRRARTLLYFLLYLFPLLIFAGLVFLKLAGSATQGASWAGVFGCGFVMLIPPSIIVVVGMLTQQKLVKSLDAKGVRSNLGRRFLWQNLYYVDHVSKITRVGGASRKVEDNQLELVFADGKAIIPPLIYDREQVWDLINSMPAQVRIDGEVRAAPPVASQPANFDEFVKMLGELKPPDGQNK